MVHVIYKGCVQKKGSIIDIITEFLDKILDDYHKKNYTVNLVLCTNHYIKTLNSKYRNINEPTDVLSFSMENSDGEGDFFTDDIKRGEEEILGEIVISSDQAKKQSLAYCISEEEELARLAIHGLLHLLGFDHEKSKRDEKIMLERQDAYIHELLKRYTIA